MDKNPSSRSANSCRIEIELLDRHKKLKHKLNLIKIKKIKAQLDHNKPAPTISSKSRRLANRSNHDLISTASRVKRTHEILKSTNFMPKKVKLSIKNLQSMPRSYKILSKKSVRYDQVLTSPRHEEPITFPSLPTLNDYSEDSLFEIPADISTRNRLMLSLKTQEPSEPSAKPENLSFDERSKLWMSKKTEKVKRLKEKNESLETESCTFRPTLNSPSFSKMATSRDHSVKSLNSSRNSDRRVKRRSVVSSAMSIGGRKSEVGDNARVLKQFGVNRNSHGRGNSLCPVSMSVSYFSGYSSSLKKKLKPVINYSVLNVRT